MKRKAIVAVSIALLLILVFNVSVFASSVTGKLIPVPTPTGLYVSGSGSFTFKTQSDNTVLVTLSVRKLPPNQKCSIWILYEGSTVISQYNIGNPTADANGNLVYTGFVFDRNSGYPTGFPSGVGTVDFNVCILDGTNPLPEAPWQAYTMLESDYKTLTLN